MTPNPDVEIVIAKLLHKGRLWSPEKLTQSILSALHERGYVKIGYADMVQVTRAQMAAMPDIIGTPCWYAVWPAAAPQTEAGDA